MQLKSKQRGFTIVEMMIAMSIFSAIIMLMSAVVIGLSKQYQKAVISAKLNDASQTIHAVLNNSISYSSSIDLSHFASASQNDWGYFCADGYRYFWHTQSGTSIGSNPGLYKDQVTSGTCDGPGPGSAAVAENLLPQNGFVTNLKAEAGSNPMVYEISTVFNVGSIDYFTLGKTGSNDDVASADTVCLTASRGGDFCAQNKYVSTVLKKVGSN